MKVVLSGSGTAGHITPLLAVAKATLRKAPDTSFVFIGHKGDKNIEVVRASGLPIEIKLIYCGKFRRFHNLSLIRQIFNIGPNLKNFRDAFLIAFGFWQALWVMLRTKPDVALLKGGSVVVPVGKMCSLRKVPYITHDSDAIPGLANALIAKGAAVNAVALKSGGLRYDERKVVEVGIPLGEQYIQARDMQRSEARKTLGIPEDALVLFVYLGTQGAKIVDDALEACATELLASFPRLHVFQVFGRLNEGTMDKRYASLAPELTGRIHKLSFVHNAHEYICASDLVLARAGATTMAEVACIGRAAIIVPAEQLTGGHQLQNAEVYQAKGAVHVLREADLANLQNVVGELLGDETKRASLEVAARSAIPIDAAERLAELLLNTGGGVARQ